MSFFHRRTAPKSGPAKGSYSAELWFGFPPSFLGFQRSLLDILRLFAEFFQFGFERDYLPRDQAVICFRADGINLSVHFLREKVQHAPHRFPGFPAVIELLKMALQPGQLFRNIRAVSEVHHLLKQSVVFKARRFQTSALDTPDQLLAIPLRYSGSMLLNLSQRLSHDPDPFR